jgi:GDPmannose 4,6-dehydratase
MQETTTESSVGRRCLITGVTGQDGAYLARFLLDRGYEVWGTFADGSGVGNESLDALGIGNRVRLLPLDLRDGEQIRRVLEEAAPQELYNFAAQSNVATAFREPVHTAEVTALGVARLLDAVLTIDSQIRFYQASSSEMFGGASADAFNEESPFHPRSPYATAKVYAHWATVNYREAHGLFAVSGIAFNHESPLRPPQFVTRKISLGVARIRAGVTNELALGNVDARRDWGHAREYVEGMWLALQQPEPTDYVFATGEAHSVKEFAEEACKVAGLEVDEHLRVDSSLLRPADVDISLGDPTKARERLGWEARVRFGALVREMVEADIALLEGATAPGAIETSEPSETTAPTPDN